MLKESVSFCFIMCIFKTQKQWLISFFIFSSTGGALNTRPHAKWVLYHLNHSDRPFCVGHFQDMPELTWTVILLFVLLKVTGMTDTNHHTQP
jgi:hypothetical protein